MMDHEVMMRRCLELAQRGAGYVAPNPMVGAVVVHDGIIIGEGSHQVFGGAHAEVNAIQSLVDSSQLSSSTIFINLEPCSYFGKTPPCADLIIEQGIPNVVIGCLDPNPRVAGEGMKKLEQTGCKVQFGVLKEECEFFNRRFFTYHQKNRPYIILKWAQSQDGFIAPINGSRVSISNEFSKVMAHRWRSEEAAIMVGTNTARLDNPVLDARLWNSNQPVRVVLDRDMKLAPELHLFDHAIPTIFVTEKQKRDEKNLEFFQTPFSEKLLQNLIQHLHEKQLLSLLVEGGSRLHQLFINENLWDEIRIFVAPHHLGTGVAAPRFMGDQYHEEQISGDRLLLFKPAK